MRFTAISYERRDGQGVIALKAHSGQAEQLANLHYELGQLADEVAWDQQLRVILLTASEPGGFCFGPGTPSWREEDGEEHWALAEQVARFDKPVIAVLEGDVCAQGLEMALACDVRIAAQDSRLAMPQVAAGLMPFDGGSQRLPRLVGLGKAMEIILGAEVLGAAQAMEIGLLNKVAAPGDCLRTALEWGQKAQANGPLAMRFVKEAMNKGLDMSLEQGLRLEADLYFLLHTTQDRTEGITSFLAKKSPDFKGE
ncbi:MAG: enoyl-CoA hydratase/isomerase family protein [Desulfarculaceae bacterium]|nr:enoyl-CoA hydratase/isomerase family protein [Desulfarculaceae bacterium]MCF8047147.1 enoyl-CoA hydratase/isomerase family protein [Desulfarculaceae bacterium]MCF8063778.1 enoyl-CoA hydratase/isomerase family protein [Desulfarculaceae bacterium]MCF8120772.1 enoyl-CoA hydratase/isomerase family protein [Desulfarculaceae bacterium]